MQLGTWGQRNSVSLDWLGNGDYCRQGRWQPGEAVGSRNRVQGGSLHLSRRIWWISPQILSCAAHWVCAFSGPSPLFLLTPPHVCPCSALCLLLTQSSRPRHYVFHVAFQGTASACRIDLQSHFLETKFCLNTEECVLQRSPRQSKVKNPFGKQTWPVHGVSHFDVPLSSTHVYSKEGLERSRWWPWRVWVLGVQKRQLRAVCNKGSMGSRLKRPG